MTRSRESHAARPGKPPRAARGGKRAGGAKRDLVDIISTRPGYLIRRVHQIAELYFGEETASFGVTSVQYGALLSIRAQPGIDQLRLGNAMRCDRTTVSGVVRRLEDKRLIVRRTEEADRRAKALFLTRAGERLLGRIESAVRRAEGRILTGLDAAERRRALALLAQVVRRFEERGGY
jgi:DNA-binding MarR family transcriptional regulator